MMQMSIRRAPPERGTAATCALTLVASGFLALSFGPTRAATPVYVTPDVPTLETLGGTNLLPWQIVKYDGLAYTPALLLPGNPTVGDIHRMDKIANWLFVVEVPNDLGGALPSPADPRDVVRFDGTTLTYSLFFCGASLTVPIPPGVRLDALDVTGGDVGNLIVSFDVPVTLGAFQFDPADLVRYIRTGPGCAGWTLAAANPDFDASAAGIGINTSSNVIAAARAGAQILLSFDVPTDLGPPGVTTYVPGQIVAWSGAGFSLFQTLTGWPRSSGVAGLAWSGNPGRVPPTIHVDKAGANITVTWSTSCSQGADDYEIYEGTIGTWYSHTSKVCTDTAHDLTETFAPAVASDYYLVVPRNAVEEGSYGANSGGVDRPVGIAQCVTPQILTTCPP
jgi:hypothetical protein